MTKYYVRLYVMIVDIIFVKRYIVSCKSVQDIEDTEQRITAEARLAKHVAGFSEYWLEELEIPQEEVEMFREDGYTVYSKDLSNDDLIAEKIMAMSNDDLNAMMDDESLWD